MVHNYVCSCSICNTPIRLRFQVDHYDIPVNIHCPVCSTLISGTIIIKNDDEPVSLDQNQWFQYQIKNVHETNDKPIFVAELSAEFFQRKLRKDDEIPDITPFLRMMMLGGEESVLNLQSLHKSYDGLLMMKDSIKNLSNLWINNKFDILIQNLEKDDPYTSVLKSSDYVYAAKSMIDARLILHHARKYWLSGLLNKQTFVEADKVRITVHGKPFLYPEIARFSNYLYGKNMFLDFDIKILKLTEEYIDLFPLLIPIVNSYEIIDRFDLNELGVTTVSYENLVDFYMDMYETYCDHCDLIIGMNNIMHRQKFDSFSNRKGSNFDEIVSSVGSKYNKVNQLVNGSEVFGNTYKSVVNNNIRNAIAHRTFNMDVINQRINFIDRNKDKEKINSLYFVEFGVLCLKLFYQLNVLYEVKHQLEMFYLVVLKREKQNYGLPK